MWNQGNASAAGAPAAPGATTSGAGFGGSNSNATMSHAPGHTNLNVRTASLTNTSSGLRRPGTGLGGGPAPLASPATAQPFARPFGNAAFPGTATMPRSAAPPHNASAFQRSIQHLSLLTTRTPASLAKLHFSPQTTVFWQRLQRHHVRSTPETSLDEQHQQLVDSDTTSLEGSYHTICSAWDSGVHDVMSSIHKARSRSHDMAASDKTLNDGLKLLTREPLVYTSSAATQSQPHAQSTTTDPFPRQPRQLGADLWIFVVVSDPIDHAAQIASNGATESSTQLSDAATSAAEAVPTAEPAQMSTVSSALDPKFSVHLPSDLAKSLTRLTAVANVTSGSYLLASASLSAVDLKGKQSSLTSEQRKAHKRFIASIKARVVDSTMQSSSTKINPPTGSSDAATATATARSIQLQMAKTRFRLGENVVFLPRHRDGIGASRASDSTWFSESESATKLGHSADQCSIIAELTISLTNTSIFVRATSRRLTALPLISTRHAQVGTSSASHDARTTLLLAPTGRCANLIGVVPTSSLAGEHLAELQSLFTSPALATTEAHSSPEAIFASGLAICALPSAEAASPAPQEQPDVHDVQQQQDTAHIGFTPIGTEDHVMEDGSPSVPPQHDYSHPEIRQENRQFLWPVSWCIVLGQSGSAAQASRSRTFAQNNLQTIQSQPMTPLKELVSFTLKVLNDANENTLKQTAAPYTPGEPEDTSLSRHGMDRLPSTRPDVTPASIAFPDFDFAMPTAASATSAQSLAPAAQSVSSTSPAKREPTATEQGQASQIAEPFGDDLNWMQFLPQASEPAARASTAATVPTDATSQQTSATNANAQNKPESNGTQPSLLEPNWAFQQGSMSVSPGPGTAAGAAPASSTQPAPQGFLQPHSQTHSHNSTPFHTNAATPLGFAAPQTKRKAGENDIFGNLGLLTEDDFSFFDESAFGLEPDTGIGELTASIPQHHDQPHHRPSTASSNNGNFGQPNTAATANSQPHPSAAAGIEDVAMGDVEQSSLDALFSAIPGLQDAMVTSEHQPAQDPVPLSSATSSGAPASGGAAAAIMANSSLLFQPGMSSFTPRDASSAASFGDPASLPGFTPSSLTESSPAFGHPNHKTPRTPYSPVEQFRDSATIVDVQNAIRLGDSTQNIYERNATVPSDGHGQQSFGSGEAESHLKEEQLHHADASTAASAAAHAAMENDSASRKRPAIVPNAFLPLVQQEARKPLQRLATGARASLGRKYDLLGKFASKPKSATTIMTTGKAVNASSNDLKSSAEAGKPDSRTDRASAPEQGPGKQAALASHFSLGATRQALSKVPARRGQALLQLRRDRNSKALPGASFTAYRRRSGQRTLEYPATPRSSDDIAMSGTISASDGDTSSSGEDDSDDGLSDAEGPVVSLSAEDQMMLTDFSRQIVSSYLCGATMPGFDGQVNAELSSLKQSALQQFALARPSGWTSSTSLRTSVARRMLSRTARWLVENPQFRAMYATAGQSVAQPDVAVSEKIEVLEALASALSLPSPSPTTETASADVTAESGKVEVGLPTLQSLVKPSTASSSTEAVELAEVLEPTKIAVGCQGSVVEALPSALMLWDKSKLSAVSGQKHVVAKVLLTHASPAWHDEIMAWLDRLRIAFESHGLGTHVCGTKAILSVADTSESLALSSYLDRLWKDGEAWLDTLRSIAGRVQLHLLQGKHVVLYTLQPPTSASCSSTGFHGLLRLEADLRAMLSEQVGVLAEQLLVRPVSPSMMTESGSLGFSQQAHSLRRLAFSVYDQLPRLVRRQPAKVLHGREAGPISAVVQFPAFSLSTRKDAVSTSKLQSAAANTQQRTTFSLDWQEEPATAVDEQVLLHIAYRICRLEAPGRSQQPLDGDAALGRDDGGAGFDASRVFGHGASAGPGVPSDADKHDEKLVLVSAIDEHGASSTVDVFALRHGNLSIEACIERVWRFAVAEASRARVDWRLCISSAGLMSEREQRAWQRLIRGYLSVTDAKDRVMGSVALLSVRPDESGAILADQGVRTRPTQEWTQQTPAADKANSVLLDAADYSQMLRFAEGVPLGWTQPFGASAESIVEEGGEEQEQVVEPLAMPVSSAILVHRARRDVLSSNRGSDGRSTDSHVVGVDLIEWWNTPSKSQKARDMESEKSSQLDAVLHSLHRLRLISEERHELPYPFNSQPWPVAAVNTLARYLGDVVLVD